jgi:hypothetical protein
MDIVTLALAKKYADSVAGGGSNITIDATLTEEGQTADAKAVGNALSEKASEDYVTQQIEQLSFEDIGSDVSATAQTLGSGTSATVSIEGNIFHFGIPKGDTGAQGPAGPKGEDGKGVTILGSYDTEEELFEEHPTGNIGDSYLVNGNLYVWSGTEITWKNVGTIEGPQGPQGPQGEKGEKGDKGDPGADGADGLTTAIALQKSEGDTTTYEQVNGTITLTGDNVFNAFNMGTYTLDEFRAQASKGFIISRLTLPQEIRGHLELLGGTIVRNGLNVNDSYLYVKSNVEVDFSAGNGNYVRINNGLLSFLGTNSGDLKAQWQQSLGIPTDAIGQATADSRYLAASLKGAVNGVAELDETGKVLSSQLPSYVDDVIDVDNYEALPDAGESGKIYITVDNNKTYRWSGAGYAEISSSLALGETAASAFRGDWGKVAYDHAQAKGSAFGSGLYKIVTNAEGHVTGATAVTADDIGGLVDGRYIPRTLNGNVSVDLAKHVLSFTNGRVEIPGLYIVEGEEIVFYMGGTGTVSLNNTAKASFLSALGLSDALTQTTADSRYLATSLKGTANGVATLDENSKLTTSQFPDSNDIMLYNLGTNVSQIPEGADLNDYKTAGTYVCPNSATSATILNKPQTNTSLGFKLIVQYNQSQNWFTQFFYVIDQVYVRYYNNTEQAYNQWKLIPAMDPPVYGSNTKGYWEKLPGSIMIAWGTATTGVMPPETWMDIVFNFPLAFSSAPMVIAVPRYDSNVEVTLNVGGSSTDGAWCHVYYRGNSSDRVNVNWMAIGSY